jgi:hypothetical protein
MTGSDHALGIMDEVVRVMWLPSRSDGLSARERVARLEKDLLIRRRCLHGREWAMAMGSSFVMNWLQKQCHRDRLMNGAVSTLKL